MATAEQIKELAYTLWEQDGCPEGKDQEYYFRAQKILEEKERPSVIELPASPALPQLAPAKKTLPGRRKRLSK